MTTDFTTSSVLITTSHKVTNDNQKYKRTATLLVKVMYYDLDRVSVHTIFILKEVLPF